MIIDKLYAWISTDEDGQEGVIGISTADGWMPAVGSDQARMESLRPVAETVARATGRHVLLKVFSTGVVIDEVPGSEPN